MKRLLLVLLAVAPLAGAAPKPLPIHSFDFHPNPKFHPRPPLLTADMAQGAVDQVGEVVVLEGDSQIVSDDGNGNFGISVTNTLQQPQLITQRFFTAYPDQFDEIIVFTTFFDAESMGALAYEMSAQQDVYGLGQPLFDQTGTDGWGPVDPDDGMTHIHRLHAFVNMNLWNQYHFFDGVDETDPSSSLYSTLGQEFAHRWLSFLEYRDANGNKSKAMLGRDMAHWASTLQAFASVMDGNQWQDNGDGSFTNIASFQRYSPLDLYAMGLIPPSQVDPFFRIANATHLSGTPVDPTRLVGVGTVLHGTREDITIDQVVAASAARSPSSDMAPHDFRVAFVLLTRPGEHVADVVPIAQQLDQIRKVWEKAFANYSNNTGTMCTQVSAPCGAPTARIVGGAVAEAGGNHNGVVEPGEPFVATFNVSNDGPAQATQISVALVESPQVNLPSAPVTLAALAPGQTAQVSFAGDVPKSAPCGVPVALRATSSDPDNLETLPDGGTGSDTFRGTVSFTPGLATALDDAFDGDNGQFVANLDRSDTATKNGWAWGIPQAYFGHAGWIFQPQGGNNGSGRAWFTGLSVGHRAQTDSSLGAGTSRLWSPLYDLSQLYQPVLHYFAWFQAINFSNLQNPQDADHDLFFLLVEGSVDDGKTWTTLDTVNTSADSWQERTVPLAGMLSLGKAARFRFSVNNLDTSSKVVMEAGLDDFQITTLTQACNPNAPMVAAAAPQGSCSTDGAGDLRSPAGAMLLLFAVVAALRWRARRTH